MAGVESSSLVRCNNCHLAAGKHKYRTGIRSAEAKDVRQVVIVPVTARGPDRRRRRIMG